MPRIVARLTIQAAVFAALLLAIGTPAAPAGTMRLYSCQTPSGRTVGTAGWTHSPVITRTEAFNDCAAGPNGTLYAEARGPHPLSRRELGVTWRLDAPPSTSITGFATRLCAKSVAPGGLVSVGWNPRFPLSIYDSLQLMTGDFGVEFNALTCVGGPPYRADVRNEVQQSGIATSRLSIGIPRSLERHRTGYRRRVLRLLVRTAIALAANAVGSSSPRRSSTLLR